MYSWAKWSNTAIFWSESLFNFITLTLWLHCIPLRLENQNQCCTDTQFHASHIFGPCDYYRVILLMLNILCIWIIYAPLPLCVYSPPTVSQPPPFKRNEPPLSSDCTLYVAVMTTKILTWLDFMWNRLKTDNTWITKKHIFYCFAMKSTYKNQHSHPLLSMSWKSLAFSKAAIGIVLTEHQGKSTCFTMISKTGTLIK